MNTKKPNRFPTHVMGIALVGLGFGVGATGLSTAIDGNALPASPLLAIDQHRDTVVERVVGMWGEALEHSGSGLNAVQLRALLTGLRSDHLLAASLAGNLEGLRNVIAGAVVSDAPVKGGLIHAKALGDPTVDLVYTPVTPCREVDTRNAGGPIGTNSSRDFKVWVGSGGFAAQGGSATNCNIPANPVAVVVNITMVAPAGLGNLIAYPTGTPTFTSVLNYQSGQLALANGAIVAVCTPNCTNQLTIATNGAGAEVVIDIVGYFKPALNSTTGAFEVAVGGNLALRIQPDATSPLLSAGYSGNTVTAGASGGSIGGGGATGTTVLSLGYDCGTSCANRVTDAFGTVGGGVGNQAGDGAGTTDDNAFNTVSGGLRNTARGGASTVGGGRANTASGILSTVGGGDENSANGLRSTVGGGGLGIASGAHSTIGGGSINLASAEYSTVAGGWQNAASGKQSTVGGGMVNAANGDIGTVGGGFGNTAGGVGGTISGGWGNRAGTTDYGTVGGGYNNYALGAYSTVPGGGDNEADGNYSFAAGRRARARTPDVPPTFHDGVFIFADSSDFYFYSTAANQFTARATGGVRFVTAIDGSGNPTKQVSFDTNGNVNASGVFNGNSDRDLKEEIAALDSRAILDKLVALPLSTWRYRTDDRRALHMGPMAQDFHAMFALGVDDTHIATVDADGVALAAIQGLNGKVQEQFAAKDAEIGKLKQQIAELQRTVEMISGNVNK